MNINGYDIIEREYDTVALDSETGGRIGSYDRTAGASRGTIRGRVVARTFHEWIQELESL